MPNLGHDPIMAAVQLAQSLQTTITRNLDPLDPAERKLPLLLKLVLLPFLPLSLALSVCRVVLFVLTMVFMWCLCRVATIGMPTPEGISFVPPIGHTAEPPERSGRLTEFFACVEPGGGLISVTLFQQLPLTRVAAESFAPWSAPRRLFVKDRITDDLPAFGKPTTPTTKAPGRADPPPSRE